MGRISEYVKDDNFQNNDKTIGTDALDGKTVNFPLWCQKDFFGKTGTPVPDTTTLGALPANVIQNGEYRWVEVDPIELYRLDTSAINGDVECINLGGWWIKQDVGGGGNTGQPLQPSASDSEMKFDSTGGYQIGSIGTPSSLATFSVDTQDAIYGGYNVVFYQGAALPSFDGATVINFSGNTFRPNELCILLVSHFVDNSYILTVQTSPNPNESMDIAIPVVADGTQTFVQKAPYGGTIIETVGQCASGSCDISFAINGVNLGGGVNSVTTTESSIFHDGNNVFVAGDTLSYTISSNSSCLGMAVGLLFIKTEI